VALARPLVGHEQDRVRRSALLHAKLGILGPRVQHLRQIVGDDAEREGTPVRLGLDGLERLLAAAAPASRQIASSLVVRRSIVARLFTSLRRTTSTRATASASADTRNLAAAPLIAGMARW
jgi:hypothetical protein